MQRLRNPAALLAGLGVASGGTAIVVSLVSAGSPGLVAAVGLGAGALIGGAFTLWTAFHLRQAPADGGADDETARAILSAIPEGVVVVRDGAVTAANRRFCTMLGTTRDELVGSREPFPFWPPESRHEIERWQLAVGERGSFEAELELRHASGARVPVILAGSVIKDAIGKPRTQVITARDITARRQVENQLAELASRDPLTALLNEWGFQERLEEEIARAKAADRPLSLALLSVEGSLDRRALLGVVDRLRDIVRAGEQLARTQEAEIGWILPETTAEGALAAVARARKALREGPEPFADDVVLTAGICDLEHGSTALTLYALADRALAAARAAGGDRTVLYSPQLAAS